MGLLQSILIQHGGQDAQQRQHGCSLLGSVAGESSSSGTSGAAVIISLAGVYHGFSQSSAIWVLLDKNQIQTVIVTQCKLILAENKQVCSLYTGKKASNITPLFRRFRGHGQLIVTTNPVLPTKAEKKIGAHTVAQCKAPTGRKQFLWLLRSTLRWLHVTTWQERRVCSTDPREHPMEQRAACEGHCCLEPAHHEVLIVYNDYRQELNNHKRVLVFLLISTAVTELLIILSLLSEEQQRCWDPQEDAAPNTWLLRCASQLCLYCKCTSANACPGQSPEIPPNWLKEAVLSLNTPVLDQRQSFGDMLCSPRSSMPGVCAAAAAAGSVQWALLHWMENWDHP